MSDDLDADITDAAAELRAAREVANRNPSGANCKAEDVAERNLNELLERRYRQQTAERIVTA